ncbi:hypothetical protein SK128_027113 [Halocaridina rubra]|uniref:Uncharacterized protein n=1 Tax=Halocaridina rubra TaxID=373956 RepID=A0AAN8X0Q6_HALRR
MRLRRRQQLISSKKTSLDVFQEDITSCLPRRHHFMSSPHLFFACNATQTTKEIAHAKGWLKNLEEVLREKEELLPIRILKAVPFFGKNINAEDFLPATGTQQFDLESLQLKTFGSFRTVNIQATSALYSLISYLPGFKRFAGTFTEGQAYKQRVTMATKNIEDVNNVAKFIPYYAKTLKVVVPEINMRSESSPELNIILLIITCFVAPYASAKAVAYIVEKFMMKNVVNKKKEECQQSHPGNEASPDDRSEEGKLLAVVEAVVSTGSEEQIIERKAEVEEKAIDTVEVEMEQNEKEMETNNEVSAEEESAEQDSEEQHPENEASPDDRSEDEKSLAVVESAVSTESEEQIIERKAELEEKAVGTVEVEMEQNEKEMETNNEISAEEESAEQDSEEQHPENEASPDDRSEDEKSLAVVEGAVSTESEEQIIEGKAELEEKAIDTAEVEMEQNEKEMETNNEVSAEEESAEQDSEEQHPENEASPDDRSEDEKSLAVVESAVSTESEEQIIERKAELEEKAVSTVEVEMEQNEKEMETNNEISAEEESAEQDSEEQHPENEASPDDRSEDEKSLAVVEGTVSTESEEQIIERKAELEEKALDVIETVEVELEPEIEAENQVEEENEVTNFVTEKEADDEVTIETMQNVPSPVIEQSSGEGELHAESSPEKFISEETNKVSTEENYTELPEEKREELKPEKILVTTQTRETITVEPLMPLPREFADNRMLFMYYRYQNMK